jgi:hypothetical protein
MANKYPKFDPLNPVMGISNEYLRHENFNHSKKSPYILIFLNKMVGRFKKLPTESFSRPLLQSLDQHTTYVISCADATTRICNFLGG